MAEPTERVAPAPINPTDLDRSLSRSWLDGALRTIEIEAAATPFSPLVRFELPNEWGIDLFLKDESAQPTGSLKHRLVRALLFHALCSGWITEGATLVDASSGSTAISEAYFARLLSLPFIAVVPRSTTQEKIDRIERYAGTCEFVDDASEMQPRAAELAAATGGHYLNQFKYAERVSDWQGEANIAAEIFAQLREERFREPRWIVVGAGTGGTSATIGRYIRSRRHPSKVMVVDPERSAFFESWATGNEAVIAMGSAIEGIGRPRSEPSFVPSTIDRMMQVPDAASIAAMRVLARRSRRSGGASSGTAFYGSLRLISEMLNNGEHGSVVSILCDAGDLYANTYYDDDWVKNQGWDIGPPMASLEEFLGSGIWPQ